MRPEARVEVLVATSASLGESPVWDAAHQLVYWVDMFAGIAHVTDPASATDQPWDLGRPVASVILEASGRLVVVHDSNVARTDSFGLARRDWLLPEGTLRGLRINEAKCDPRGRLWLGCVATDPGQPGCLMWVDASGTLVSARTGIGLANGMGWSPDGRLFYEVDTARNAIDVMGFDPSSGQLSGAREFLWLPASQGRLDGLAVDEAGGIWVALFGGGAVRRYTPDGTLDAVIMIPTAQVTSCCFAGESLNDLIVTTGSSGSPRGDEFAGSLFRARTDAAGVPVAAFAELPRGREPLGVSTS